jgi:hypothetical protein
MSDKLQVCGYSDHQSNDVHPVEEEMLVGSDFASSGVQAVSE